jgi:hypothetical protein
MLKPLDPMKRRIRTSVSVVMIAKGIATEESCEPDPSIMEMRFPNIHCHGTEEKDQLRAKTQLWQKEDFRLSWICK